jgi:ketosteroid isomerase-like protein
MTKKSMYSALSCTVLIVFYFTSCNPPDPAGLNEEDKQYFRDVTTKVQDEWNNGRREPYADRFSNDAIYMAPNMASIVGKDSISAFANSFPELKLNFSVLEISGTAELAYVRGIFKVSNPADSLLEKGKYLSIWKKFPGNKWLLTHDIFNSDLPLLPPKE